MTANKLEGKARELLAAEYEQAEWHHSALAIRLGRIDRAEGIAIRAIIRALDTARQNDLDATVAQRDALAGKVVAYRMFDHETVEAFRKWCPWIDGAPSQASFDALKDRCEFQFAYAGTARQSEGMVLVPRNEAERLVKVLRYAAHPQPSPHGDYLAGLIAAAPADAGEG